MLSVTWMRGHECPVYPLSANSASAWNSFCTGAQYYDAKWVQKAVTRLVLVETLGGIAPPTKQFLHVFAKEAVGTNTDRTVYGAASASASSFVLWAAPADTLADTLTDAARTSALRDGQGRRPGRTRSPR